MNLASNLNEIESGFYSKQQHPANILTLTYETDV